MEREVGCIPLIVMPSYLTICGGQSFFEFVIAKNWFFVLFLSLWVVIGSSVHPPPVPGSPLLECNSHDSAQIFTVYGSLVAEVFRVQLFCSLFLQLVVSEGVWYCIPKILTAWLTSLMAPKLHCYAKLKHRPWCSLSLSPPSFPFSLSFSIQNANFLPFTLPNIINKNYNSR